MLNAALAACSTGRGTGRRFVSLMISNHLQTHFHCSYFGLTEDRTLSTQKPSGQASARSHGRARPLFDARWQKLTAILAH